MRALSWLVVTPTALLLGACTALPVAHAPALDYRPAPRSTLVTSAAVPFLVARQRDGEAQVTTLARLRPGKAPQPVARLLQRGESAGARIAIQLSAEADADAAVAEQVYALVLRLEPQARLCLGRGPQPCDADADGLSHAAVLQALAEARDQGVALQPAALRWHVIELVGAATSAWDPDTVAARATGPDGPLAGATLYFNRAPHSLCMARTDADGLARCQLVDQHGDAQSHDHAAAVVVTFPGDIQARRVLPPTTAVARPAQAAAVAFARPIPWGLPRD